MVVHPCDSIMNTSRPWLWIPLCCALALGGCRDHGSRATADGVRVSDSSQFTTGDFDGCGPGGDGGDPDLNRMKNRDVAPKRYAPLAIESILASSPKSDSIQPREHRSRWPDALLNELSEWENSGAQVEGYLLKVRQEGKESCNCHSEDHRDYHLWVAAHSDDGRDKSVVMEISPRTLPAHPNWQLRTLERLATDHARVRMSGWMMWDSEHPDQVGETRGTLWEIHPIHRIEVWSDGAWRDLDG